MEGLRALLATSFFGLAGLGLYFLSYDEVGISVTGAELAPMGDGFMLTAKIENTGRADRLTAIASDAAASVLLSGGAPDGLAIPAESAPGLSSDGVHGMISGIIGGTEKGRLIPVSFWFERSGKVTARARIGDADINQGASYGVPAGKVMPDVFITAKPEGQGWKVEVITSGFTFSKEAVDGPHQSGVGHGHLYLNDLRLQPIYGPEVHVGALPKGTHQLRVTLNTNDHRAYSVGGVAVTAIAEITVD